MPLSIDDAIDLIVQKLKRAPPLDSGPNARPTWCDVLVSDVLKEWWFREHRGPNFPDPTEADWAPFYDGAWELCRRGILRMGAAFPTGQRSYAEPADGYSLTSFGRQWVAVYDRQGPFPTDPGRFAALIAPYSTRFGPGFIQRASEGAGCYRTSNYLACCAMCGAATESVLLAVAIAKTGDAETVLRKYRGASGRRTVIDLVLPNLSGSIASQFRTAMSLLSYWRDEAAHGGQPAITEIEAHDAMSRLLRFAQFVAAEWETLTRG